MNGADFYTAVTTLLEGFQINETLFYQFLNTARIQREMMRPWMYLRKLDTSNVVAPVSTVPVIAPPSPSYTIPSDFLFLSKDGQMTLYDNNNQYENYYEIPMDLQVQYLQQSNRFFFDYANGILYFLGIVSKQYTAYIFYQADFGDITKTTTWLNIPKRYHMILAYDVAAMYRLGVDYDDVNARNAESNHQQAELLFGSMKTWDDNLQRSAVTTLDYPTEGSGENDFHNRKINM